MEKINLVKDLDSLEGINEINLRDLNKNKNYSIRLDLSGREPHIKPEASFCEMKKIINKKEYKGSAIYIKEGSYFD